MSLQGRVRTWVDLLGDDSRPWISDSPEAGARLLLASAEPGQTSPKSLLVDRAAALTDPGLQALIDGLADWETECRASGHNSPAFTPNMLIQLWWMGLRGGDSPRVERLLDQMLSHQDDDGRFQTFGRWRGRVEPAWGALLCDTHCITDVLVRYGRGRDDRTQRAVQCLISDAMATAQGEGWGCRPDNASGFRGPGRKADVCPQVTVEALRLLARCAADADLAARFPAAGALADAAGATLARLWLNRGTEKPYMFGHGRQFKRIKWPPMWYDVFAVVDALSLRPSLWRSPDPAGPIRRAVCELAACLVAYNAGSDGRVVPRSCYRGLEQYSWGQKKAASPLATAMVCSILSRIDELAPEIAAVDVLQLGSSKGGTGRVMPP